MVITLNFTFVLFLYKYTYMSNLKNNLECPIAKKTRKELIKHDDVRIDNYFWLNQREDQEVLDYLNAENDYTNSVLKHTEGFQSSLFKEMKSRIKEDDQSVPYKLNGYWYVTRFEQGLDYFLILKYRFRY